MIIRPQVDPKPTIFSSEKDIVTFISFCISRLLRISYNRGRLCFAHDTMLQPPVHLLAVLFRVTVILRLG